MRKRILLLACVHVLLAPGVANAQGMSDAARSLDKQDKDLLRQANNLQTSPTRVIVRFKSDAQEADKSNALKAASATKIRRFGLVPGLEVWHSNIGSAKAIEVLRHNSHVLYAEFDSVLRLNSLPNDHQLSSLWALNDGAGYNIHAPEAWNLFTGDPNFVIADIDTGMQIDNVDLAANVYTNPGEIPGNGIDDDANGFVDDVHGWDFLEDDNNPQDDVDHGTHTAGTMGAVGNNVLGIAGVNWQCKLMPLKFIGVNGGYSSDAIAAIQYACRMRVKLSNNSWGNTTYEQSIYDAINAAKNSGHLFVAAAGNGGVNTDNFPAYPASYNCDNIISVAAVDNNGSLASFSNFGASSVDIAAPGVNIWSTVPGNQLMSMDGTSMAAPHVTGVAALLWASNPSMTYSQVKTRILQKAVKAPKLIGTSTSEGLLDAYTTLTDSPLPPVLTIFQPNASGRLSQQQVVVVGRSLDGLDGDISNNIVWRDSIVGLIGQGPVCVTNALSIGSHQLTATVTDSRGLSTSATITVSVCSPGPVVTGSPINNVTFPEGATINLAASASDPSDGSLTNKIEWTSTLQGSLGIGASLSRCDLGPGNHVITAKATDAAAITAAQPWLVSVLPATFVPTAPTGAAWSKVISGKTVGFKISWTDASSNETSFEVEVSSQMTRKTWSAGEIAYFAPGGVNYVMFQPSGGYTYRYRVRARNSKGFSAWSSYTSALKV